MRLARKNGPMKWDLSYNEAIKIQDGQVLFYSRHMCDTGKALLRQWICSETLPYEFDKDEVIPIFEINDMVPRGCWFEGQDKIYLRIYFSNPNNQVQFVSGV